MGGLLILMTVVASTLLWADLSNVYIWIVIIVTVSFGLIGWIDDYRKVKEKNSKGLSSRGKMLGQTAAAALVIWLLYYVIRLETNLYVPFVRTLSPDLGWFYIPLAWVVMVGTSNAVNLTDGLDGLAIGPIISTAMTFGILSY